MDNTPSQFSIPQLSGEMQSEYEDFLQFRRQRQMAGTSHAVQPDTGLNPDPARTPTEGSGIPHLSIDDLLAQPGRDKLPRLDPDMEDGSTWFKYTPLISKTILKLLRNVNQPCFTYDSLPEEAKNGWFRAFAQEYNWESAITPLVRAGFEEQVKASVGNNLYEWKKRWLTNKGKPKWMSERVWNGYVEYWSLDKTKEISDKNSRNRRSNRGGDGIAIHNNGSKSYQQRKQELTQYNGGVEPSMLELLKDTHTSKKTGLINDMKVKRIIDTVQEQVQEIVSQRCSPDDGASSQQSNISVSEINRLVIEATPKVRGRRLGFGTLPDPSEGTSRRTDAQAAKIAHLEELTVQQNQTIAHLEAKVSHFMRAFFEKFPDANPDPADDDETQG